MAYSEIEQQTLDLDLFFRDNDKYIYLASAGGQIPDQLAGNDTNNKAFQLQAEELTRNMEVEINPNLARILGKDDGLEGYLASFIEMAQKGFYSYDKTNVGDFRDKFFHLVAWPTLKKNDLIEKTQNLLKIDHFLPEDFEPFDLFEYFGE